MFVRNNFPKEQLNQTGGWIMRLSVDYNAVGRMKRTFLYQFLDRLTRRHICFKENPQVKRNCIEF